MSSKFKKLITAHLYHHEWEVNDSNDNNDSLEQEKANSQIGRTLTYPN